MRALGFEVKKVDVLKILKDYNREGNGKITFDDFNEVGKFLLCLISCCIITHNWNSSMPNISVHSFCWCVCLY